MVITSDEANEPPEQPSSHWPIRGDPSTSQQQHQHQQAGSINLPTIPPPVAGSTPRYVGRSNQLSADSAITDEKTNANANDNTSKDTDSISSSNSSTCKQGSSQTSTICDFTPNSQNSYACSPRTVAEYLGSDLKNGLNSADAKDRLVSNGPNRLETSGGVSVMEVLLRQVSNSLTLVLVIAMALAYGTMDFIEGGVISGVIVLNIVVGFVQDFKAEKKMNSLQSLSAPDASVIRDGQIIKIKAEELVVGDIVRMNVGDVVPADVRLFDGMNFETDEALLTGESLPVAKRPHEIVLSFEEIGTHEMINIAFASSTVTKGRAMGIVVATGMSTQVGKIASLIGNKKKEEPKPWYQAAAAKTKHFTWKILGLYGTPLQVKLAKFALLLFLFAILLAIIVFSANKFQIKNDVLIYGICVAVAVIPESLIAVLTITMALGTQTMAKRNVIVRNMQALEAVGGVTNICSDKTGTLTQGKMVAKKAEIPNLGLVSVDDVAKPFDPYSGQVKINDSVVEDKADAVRRNEPLQKFLNAISLCNLAIVSQEASPTGPGEKGKEVGSNSGEWKAVGEPTEISLQVLAMRFGNGKTELLNTKRWQILAEHGFDSTIKRMSVVYKDFADGSVTAFMKGAAEVIIPTLNIKDEEKERLINRAESLASEGLRVLCVASKSLDNMPADDIEDENNNTLYSDRKAIEVNMDFLGLVGLYDPPRQETAGAVRKCKLAGIKVHMLTGDHIQTATAIAKEVGILPKLIPSNQSQTIVMSARDFDNLSDAEIDAMPDLPAVIARCSPATKVKMVESLHRRGAFCVMTGDGVNDSPALKRANVGIAMGLAGSDVAKDAADMVLTDDNFASIVSAVEEGRRLFDNIQKFIVHLLISNIAQVVLLLIGLVFRDSRGVSVFPLSPLEILWVNMITSSFLAIGLGLEEAQPDVMLRPPADMKAGVFTWEVITDKMIYGVSMGGLCLFAFSCVIYMAGDKDLAFGCNESFSGTCADVYRARATVFSTLSFLLLVTAWEVKHFSRSLFNLSPSRFGKGPMSFFRAIWYNKTLFWAVVAGFVITFPCVYIPGFNRVVFHHIGITWEWGIVVGALVVYVAIIESWKAIKRHFRIWSGALTVYGEEDAETRVEEGEVVRGET